MSRNRYSYEEMEIPPYRSLEMDRERPRVPIRRRSTDGISIRADEDIDHRLRREPLPIKSTNPRWYEDERPGREIISAGNRGVRRERVVRSPSPPRPVRVLERSSRITAGPCYESDEDRYPTRSHSHVRRRPSYEEDLRRRESISPSRDVPTIWNTSTRQDTTIHFNLNIEEDFEGDLEEFSRLKRLGNFKAAEEFFQANLFGYIEDSPYVAVEYADMLLEQGAYGHLFELNQDYGPFLGKVESPAFQSHWALIIACADMQNRGGLREAVEVLESSHRSRRVSSTEVQILKHQLQIIGYLTRHSNYYSQARNYHIKTFDWEIAYPVLLKNGRIWEVRDILCGSIFAFGVVKTWRNFFEMEFYSKDFFDQFFEDWTMDDYDESTYLAILDILIVLVESINAALRMSSPEAILSTRKKCLDYARNIAASISQNTPESMKSRPYLRWLLVEERLRAELNNKNVSEIETPAFSYKYMEESPGIIVTMIASPHCFYIPMKGEIPQRQKVEDKPQNALQMALRAAQEMNDYRSEVICLRDLISESTDPTKLYTELIHLQRTVQDDQMGYLETCLSKYLFLDGQTATQSLADEITMFCGQSHVTGLASDPFMEWCLRMIQSSLNYSLKQFTKGRYAQSAAEAHQEELPEDFQKLIATNFSGFESKSTRHESTIDYGVKGDVRNGYRRRVDVYRDYLRRPSPFHTAQELSSAIITRISTNSKDPRPRTGLEREVGLPPPPRPAYHSVVVATNERKPESRPTSPLKEQDPAMSNELAPYGSIPIEVKEVGRTSGKPIEEKPKEEKPKEKEGKP